MNRLRRHLRETTHASHMALDEAVGGLDIRQVTDLSRYLHIHRAAIGDIFDGLADRATPDAPWRETLAALDGDLKDLPAFPAPQPLGAPRQVYAGLGAAYVVGGSSLGGRLQRETWRTATDAAVLAASRFFNGDGLAQLWSWFNQRSAECENDAAETDRAVEDAHAAFARYRAAAQHYRTHAPAVPA